jgi:hypothetical protein
MFSGSFSQNAAVRGEPQVHRQRGGASVRLVLFMVVFGAILYSCIKIIPPFYNNYLLQDWLDEQVPVMFGKFIDHEDTLKQAIMKEITSEGVAATSDNIHILQNDSKGLNVEVDYDVNVDLSVYQIRLHFTPGKNSQSLVQ